jgi:hypothetical protein
MKLPRFFWQFVVGIVLGLLGWLSWSFTIQWAIVFGVVMGVVTNFIVVAIRGQI